MKKNGCNVLMNSSTVSYRTSIRNISDYSPFGVQLDGRTVSGDSYRYGFNGMEEDDDIKGLGNSYSTFFRQLDPRLGRWLTLDPKNNYGESPYASFGNNPILYNDPLGDTVRIQGTDKNNTTYNYIDGKTYNPNGDEYVSGDLFVSRTISELNKIREGGDEGKRLINTFVDNNVSIIQGEKGQFEFNEEENAIYLNWDERRKFHTTYGYTTGQSFIMLAHELGHAEELAFNCSLDRTIWYSPNDGSGVVYNSEKYACHVENKIRAENQFGLRTYYAEKYSFDINGNPKIVPFLPVLEYGNKSPHFNVTETFIFQSFKDNTYHGSYTKTRQFNYNTDKNENTSYLLPVELFNIIKF